VRWGLGAHLAGAVVLENVLRVDTFFVDEAVFTHGARVGEGRHILGRAHVEVGAVIVKELDELWTAVDGPKYARVAVVVDVVGIRARAQERLGGFEPTAVARAHERGVALFASIRGAEDEINVCAFLNLVINQFQIVLVNRHEELLRLARRLDDVRARRVRSVVGMVRAFSAVPLRLVRGADGVLAFFHDRFLRIALAASVRRDARDVASRKNAHARATQTRARTTRAPASRARVDARRARTRRTI